LDIGEIDWDEVAELVVGSYSLLAPKSLAARVHPQNPATSRS
jgi:hypothetical protein